MRCEAALSLIGRWHARQEIEKEKKVKHSKCEYQSRNDECTQPQHYSDFSSQTRCCQHHHKVPYLRCRLFSLPTRGSSFHSLFFLSEENFCLESDSRKLGLSWQTQNAQTSLAKLHEPSSEKKKFRRHSKVCTALPPPLSIPERVSVRSTTTSRVELFLTIHLLQRGASLLLCAFFPWRTFFSKLPRCVKALFCFFQV